MKSAAEFLAEGGKETGSKELSDLNGTGRIDKMQRFAYLKAKGIDPKSPFQLDLILPKVADFRHIPNDYARSSLFTARNKKQPRQTLTRERLFHYNETIVILYTGIELRAEDDELVWLQILNYGRSVAFGEPFEFSVKDLVRDVGWARNGRNYDRVRQCISRLKANEVLALNTKAYGKSGAISLIGNYTAINDEGGEPTQYRAWIDPNLMILFAGNTFTSHSWGIYRDLSPVARRLTDYIESHKSPYPLGLEKFRQMCGSIDSSTGSWRQTVRKACAEVREAKIAAVADLNKDDQICCIRE